MKDKDGKVIYIGKAKNLRKRVSTYFSESNNQINSKTMKLVKNISNIELIVTDNEIEAFLLESNLIKRYRPVFNIDLKDQQRYTYLRITDEKFPRLLVARRNKEGNFFGPKGNIYGPFVRGSSKYLAIGLLRKLFKIRICDKLPKKACLEYYIKNCDAPCINHHINDQYTRNISILRDILDGKNNIEKFISELEDKMKAASKLQQYEDAIEIRDTLHRLDNLRIKQKMERAINRNYEEEYIGILYNSAQNTAQVMTLHRANGIISDSKRFQFDIVGDNSLGTFILQYCSTLSSIPRFLYVNEEPASVKTLELTLEKLGQHEVNIITVTKDSQRTEKKELMDLILHNLHIDEFNGYYDKALVEMREIFALPTLPTVIDCFDISNFGSSFAVGACVRFVNGKPQKSAYRKFKIKTILNQDDFAMMHEIVKRRYSAFTTSNQDNDTKYDNDLKLPDLIVVDGGKGQLHSANEAILDLKKDIPCISIAKEREEIFTQFSTIPVILSKKSAALKLLQYLRDEAHRFSLQYNRILRRIS